MKCIIENCADNALKNSNYCRHHQPVHRTKKVVAKKKAAGKKVARRKTAKKRVAKRR